MAKKSAKAAKKPAAKAAAKVEKRVVKAAKPKNGTQYNQSEFFEQVREACAFDNRKIARNVYEAFAAMIAAALKKGYKVPLPGLGKIQVRETKARMGRNPATGEIIRIEARKRIRLTPAKALKEAVLTK